MAKARIAPVAKGDKSRTMMHASVANEVIAAVNEADAVIQALRKLKVSPEGAGSLIIAEANAVLKLPKPPESSDLLPTPPNVNGTYVLGVIVTGNGSSKAVQWLATDTCA